MLGRQERGQEELFVTGSMRDLIPDDYILKRVDKLLDLSWLRDEVRGLYDERMGRPGIDPEAAVRLMRVPGTPYLTPEVASGSFPFLRDDDPVSRIIPS